MCKETRERCTGKGTEILKSRKIYIYAEIFCATLLGEKNPGNFMVVTKLHHYIIKQPSLNAKS